MTTEQAPSVDSPPGLAAETPQTNAPYLFAAGLVVLSWCVAPFEKHWAAVDIMVFVHRMMEPVEDFMHIAAQLGSGWGIPLVFALVFLLDDRRRARVTAFASSLGLVGIVVSILKITIRRQRPLYDRRELFIPEAPPHELDQWFVLPDKLKHVFEDDFMSYPSGHSAQAAAFACCLIRFYPKGRVVWVLLAMLAMLDRVDNARHYLSDTFAGAAVGIVATTLFLRSTWPVLFHQKARQLGARFAKSADAR